MNRNVNDMAALNAAATNNPDLSAQYAELIQAQIARENLLFARETAADAKTAADEAEKRAYHEAQISQIRDTLARKDSEQNQCPHLKPNFQPAMGGQKDSKGNLHLVCSFCAKEFDNKELALPRYMHLRIPAEKIGGPQ